MKELVYSLSDLLGIIDRGFKELFGGFSFWFKAEISKISYIKGYYYIDLIEFDKLGKTKAKSRGIIFDEVVLNNFLKDIQVKNFDEIKNFELMFYGRLNFHTDYGFSIIISDISREYYLGKYKKQVDNIILKLQEKGVYNLNKNLKPGFPPFKIAVISTSGSAGFEDFKAIFANSNFNYTLQLFVAAIHGNDAISQVLSALNQIDSLHNQGIMFDFVVITRGGGGSQGIVWQNDYEIAHSICTCSAPVIVAIGHTQDKSILDEVSFYSAKTPSDAAHYLLNYYNYYIGDLNNLYKEILSTGKLKLSYYKDSTELLYTNILSRSNQLIVNYKIDLDTIYSSILSLGPDKLKDKGYGILYNNEGKIISHTNLQKLNHGDKIKIKIYNKVINAIIDNIQ